FLGTQGAGWPRKGGRRSSAGAPICRRNFLGKKAFEALARLPRRDAGVPTERSGRPTHALVDALTALDAVGFAQAGHDFDVDAVRKPSLDLAPLELLRRPLHLDERATVLNDQVAFIDREHVLSLVEHDIRGGAVVRAQEQLLVQLHRSANRELDRALI